MAKNKGKKNGNKILGLENKGKKNGNKILGLEMTCKTCKGNFGSVREMEKHKPHGICGGPIIKGEDARALRQQAKANGARAAALRAARAAQEAVAADDAA